MTGGVEARTRAPNAIADRLYDRWSAGLKLAGGCQLTGPLLRVTKDAKNTKEERTTGR